MDAQSGRLVRLLAELTRLVSLFYLGHATRVAVELPRNAREFAAREQGVGRVGSVGVETLRG